MAYQRMDSAWIVVGMAAAALVVVMIARGPNPAQESVGMTNEQFATMQNDVASLKDEVQKFKASREAQDAFNTAVTMNTQMLREDVGRLQKVVEVIVHWIGEASEKKAAPHEAKDGELKEAPEYPSPRYALGW